MILFQLLQGLEVIEVTNLKFFTKEMMAELYAMKGYFLQHLSRSEEANKVFSAAVQLHDCLVNAWALWGDYLESIFTRDRLVQNVASVPYSCNPHPGRKCDNTGVWNRKILSNVKSLLKSVVSGFKLCGSLCYTVH